MIEPILSRLRKVKQTGHNQWRACCPAHDDNDPSLGVKLCSDGRILMNCLAGCGKSDVLQSLGMSLSDLYPDGALGDYRSFMSIENDLKAKRERKARIAATIREADRANGKRLSRAELEREAEEWKRANGYR